MISTLEGGIENCQKAVTICHPSIRYLIIHQTKKESVLPRFLDREDITVIRSKTRGLSRSRNIGIKNCTTQYALVSDDDVEYIEEGIEKILSIIKFQRPDVASFKIKTPHKAPPYKGYPNNEYSLTTRSQPGLSSIEILLNIKKLKEIGIKFDQRFGLGTILKKGEETVLIHDCIKMGLKGRFYPIFIVIHPFESSGRKEISKKKDDLFFSGCLNYRIGLYRSPNKGKKRIWQRVWNYLIYYLGSLYIMLTRS